MIRLITWIQIAVGMAITYSLFWIHYLITNTHCTQCLIKPWALGATAHKSWPMWGPPEERTSGKGSLNGNCEAQSDITESFKVSVAQRPTVLCNTGCTSVQPMRENYSDKISGITRAVASQSRPWFCCSSLPSTRKMLLTTKEGQRNMLPTLKEEKIMLQGWIAPSPPL